MATYFVYSGAAGTNSGADWTNAYTAFGSAVTAATAAGDVIKVHKTHQENLGATTTYTLAANVRIICVDKDASDALDTMGTGGWIGHNTTGRQITITGTDLDCYVYGVTWRVATGTTNFFGNSGNGLHIEWENCTFWQAGSTAVTFGGNTAANNAFNKFVGCTFTFAATGQAIVIGGRAEIIGGSISAGAITTVFYAAGSTSINGVTLTVHGFDIAAGASASATLVANSTIAPFSVTMIGCKLPSSATRLATQSEKNRTSAELTLIDCANGDSHGGYEYHNPLGSLVTNASIYYTSGAAGVSWKIDTTADATFYTPFVTPWIPLYHTGTSAITPRFEIVRDGSATAYQDDEVWAEFGVKATTSSVMPTFQRDRMTPLGTAADQASGAGLGSWTGESGTAWSGKIDSGSSMTPAEVGDIVGRIVVGQPSIAVYIDPEIRT